MEHKQAAKLIIQNIQMLEEANNLLETVIHKEIFNTIDAIIQNKVSSFNEDIIGVYDHHEDQTWFLSSLWKLNSFNLEDHKTHNDIYAYYILDQTNQKDEQPQWWISYLFANNFDQAIFSFYLYKNNFPNVTKNDLKQFCIQQNEKHPLLAQTGFKFNTNNLCWDLPIAFLNEQKVAHHYENSTLEDALTPFTEALDKLNKAHEIFDAIVNDAKNKFLRE